MSGPAELSPHERLSDTESGPRPRRRGLVTAAGVGRLLDYSGTPRRLAVEDWWDLVEDFERRRELGTVDDSDDTRSLMRGLAIAAARFSRPNGSRIFGPIEPRPDFSALLRRMSQELDAPGLATVAEWWFGKQRGPLPSGPPPLPAWGDDERPIAMLRADWAKFGDLLAVDARDPANTLVELMVGGRPMLGPSWPGALGPNRAKVWRTSSTADCLEWSTRIDGARVGRTAVFLRGRKLALLAEERRGEPGERAARIAMAPGVSAHPVADRPMLTLKPASKGTSARVVPFGLPEGGGGSLTENDGALVLTARAPGRRSWMPLLVSWDDARNRRVPTWRLLTVSETARVCAAEVAFAARVTWGPGESYVIYRSLARPATRSFLGYQTSVRFLIGQFTENGNVVPLLSLD